MCRFHRTEFDLLPERAFRPRAGRHGQMTLEGGGKGSSAPAPDPRLVEAQVKSMGIQDSAIQSILKNSNELLPLQQQQMQFALDSSKTAYDQSQSDRQWLLSRRDMLSGVQDQMAKDASEFNTEGRREQLAGAAMADVNTAASNARGQSSRAVARMGINPASGRAMAMDSQIQLGQTAAAAGAANKARTDARAEGYALNDRVNNSLSGYPSMGSQATGSGAAYGTAGVNTTNASLAGQNSGFGSVASVAGQLGTNATSMFGAQATREANGQGGGESIGGMLGGLGGLATGLGKSGLGWFSDRRLKTDIEVVGRDVATGLKLYAFRYIADPTKRWIGVMADEVRTIRPDAVCRGEDGFDRVNYGLLGLEMVEA